MRGRKSQGDFLTYKPKDLAILGADNTWLFTNGPKNHESLPYPKLDGLCLNVQFFPFRGVTPICSGAAALKTTSNLPITPNHFHFKDDQ